jgi:hypothetical protein
MCAHVIFAAFVKAIKGTISQNWAIADLPNIVTVKLIYENGGLPQAKNRLRTMRHITESNMIIKYIHEYEFIFETALAHESLDPGLMFAKKT